jgi:hypothetical protein
MGTVEYARYILVCPRCKATGAAEWWETDGWVHLHSPAWGLAVWENFERVPGPEFSGPRSFYGRPLVCETWGIDAESTKIRKAASTPATPTCALCGNPDESRRTTRSHGCRPRWLSLAPQTHAGRQWSALQRPAIPRGPLCSPELIPADDIGWGDRASNTSGPPLDRLTPSSRSAKNEARDHRKPLRRGH